jgi:tRNA G18 (ribose-2'-O)-methylase SpoU
MRKLKNTELKRITTEEFKSSEKIPLTVILDNIRSMNNIGSVFRTSDAFRVEKIYLCGITATPPHKDIHKTALGATESVEWEYYQRTDDVIHQLKKDNYEILTIEQTENSKDLRNFEIDPGKKYGVVLGNEVRGVQQKIIDQCDGAIEIPQFGTKHSLNISVCTGIVIWEFFRKMWK